MPLEVIAEVESLLLELQEERRAVTHDNETAEDEEADGDE